MNASIKEIHLGQGLGELKFGISRETLQAVLGEPTEVDAYSYTEEMDELTESWHYDDLDVSMSFDEEDNWRLGTIAVSSPEYMINGKALIGKMHDEVMKAAEEMDLGDYEVEDWSNDESPDHILISFEEKSLNFWFDGGILAEIQWGPYVDEDGETHWPAS